ncbi:adenylate/guanylate cyclase domain-containing protein [Aquabacterium soli]|uniref:Adenylate/guanylate cyclase domain-containing protein n=1 Tax=Aquabacterium soli TaxID=2493092 RepID=A0A3R8YQE8_9BURK|nr:adenylate/guanylate cyclase domain-containing protein [Aquabacterium soli]RRS05625.1 adenylate/guanylate cyclase domain-containing protein [Aquabacterium soli]
MGTTKERVVLFADLRGSTALYLRLGNTEAATVVTHSVAMLGQIIAKGGGSVVKSLGDGLMAVFDDPERAVEAAAGLHDSLDRIAPVPDGLPSKAPALKLKVAMAWGEIVEVDGDCFGDAVNVAARVLDLAGDNETLATGPLTARLTPDHQERFRSLDRMHLRGRADPVAVLRMESVRFGDTVSTLEMSAPGTDLPDGIRLTWQQQERVFASPNMPVVLGRSPQASFCVGDSRVSRSHARIEGHSGHFYLTDLSYNGSYVQFDHDQEVLALRRSTCTLHGSGIITLGSPPHDTTATRIHFDVLSFSDTMPQW